MHLRTHGRRISRQLLGGRFTSILNVLLLTPFVEIRSHRVRLEPESCPHVVRAAIQARDQTWVIQPKGTTEEITEERRRCGEGTAGRGRVYKLLLLFHNPAGQTWYSDYDSR